jgi:CheR methyltransferase, SAM binding domain
VALVGDQPAVFIDNIVPSSILRQMTSSLRRRIPCERCPSGANETRFKGVARRCAEPAPAGGRSPSNRSPVSGSSAETHSCRNLLIYLRPEVQEKVISFFHFALREGGILLLGSAETIGSSKGRFEIISKAERLYRHIGRTRPEEVAFLFGTPKKRAASDTHATEPDPFTADRSRRGLPPRRP